MNVAFRVDASKQIGTGHFMRCFALADQLKKQGAHISFFSRNLPAHLSNILIGREITLIELPQSSIDYSVDELAHSSWLGCSQSQDAQATVTALSNKDWHWLIVDHYALDKRWEKTVSQRVKKIMVIDDIADRLHDCDVLLDQNYYVDMQTRYNAKVPLYCQLLAGPHYALLRDEFRVLREKVKVRIGEIKKILVFFGGVDADNYTLKTMEALSQLNRGLHVDVVIGASHPFKDQIEKSCAKYNFSLHVQISYIAKLMAEADLSIGAGGTSIWERCCLGLPTICVCTAENQRKQIADAAELGFLFTPPLGEDFKESIRLHVQALLSNNQLIKFISKEGMKLVDGKGILRVASLIECDLIEMKKVTHHDSENIFEWRNSKQIRDVSENSQLISWTDHQNWFDSVLNDSNRHLLIGEIEKKQIGVVRFDIDKNVAEVSIYLIPERNYFGKGKGLLSASERWLKINHPKIKSINARVLHSNLASKELFIGSGYRINSMTYQKDL
jgi:UDP-2,4-diacetamido-2,4,6-trideoxy-beta-L-altropyranose hydrolase